MTNMEIVNSAESIVNDPERIDYLSAGDISMLSAALGVARIILREQEERENPTPLTLAELREMDGEPVWIKLFDPDEEFWVLRNDWVDTRNPEPMILLHGRWYLHDDYGKTWLAYRQKPKEVRRWMN